MRFIKALVGVLALAGGGLALAHDPAQDHDHGDCGCCCDHEDHHARHHSSKNASSKGASSQKKAQEKAPAPADQNAPPAPAEKPAPANPK